MNDPRIDNRIMDCMEANAYYNMMGLTVIADTYLRRAETLIDLTNN